MADDDAVQDSFRVGRFDAWVVPYGLRETIPEGDFVPIAYAQCVSSVPGWLHVNWRMYRDDTLSVYARSCSVYLANGQSELVALPLWNAPSGRYFVEVFGVHDRRGMGDTTRKHVTVVSAGVGEARRSSTSRTTLVATVVSGMLDMPSAYRSRSANSILLDASGHCAMVLRPGKNDVGDLPPGVYFVRSELRAVDLKRTEIRKIVLTR